VEPIDQPRERGGPIAEALAAGRSVVVDNTNPSVSERAAIIETARSCGARVVAYFFTSPLSECLSRNAARSGAVRVPEVGLFATVKKLVPPSRDEGFHELWSVRTLLDLHFETHPLVGEVTTYVTAVVRIKPRAVDKAGMSVRALFEGTPSE
jgi:hypothetical protein